MHVPSFHPRRIAHRPRLIFPHCPPNRAKKLVHDAALSEQQREMVRKTDKLGKIIGVCLALRTLNNPKTLPRSRSKGTPGAPAPPTAQHLALADHAGIGVDDAATLDFASSSGGRVKPRGGYVETRADAEDAPGIVDRLKGGKGKAHELRQSDYSPVPPKKGTKGYHLEVQNYHTAKLVQVRLHVLSESDLPRACPCTTTDHDPTHQTHHSQRRRWPARTLPTPWTTSRSAARSSPAC